MAERIAYLEAVVGADITQFRKGMRDIRNETGILSETLQGIAGVGRSLTFALTTPLVTMGTYFAQAATEFDGNMRNINSLIKLSEGDFQGLSREVLTFGTNTRAGANAASEALYAVFSAGYGLKDTSQAMDVLTYSTRLSEAGLSDLERTTEGLTATMLTYNDGSISIARATDVWANMVGFGVGNLEGFLQNASKAMPAANALGISFENLGASAAYLSQGFASPNKAMTALGMLESNLMKPNAALALSYEKLGVTTGQELVAKFGSLEESIIAIRGVTNDLEFANGFSKTGMEAALMLTNNIDATREAYQQFYDTLDGAAMGQWQQQTQSFAYQFDRFKSALQGVAIALGSQLLPLITPLIAHITDGLVWFSQLNPEVHRFAILIGTAAAAIGPLMWVFGSLIGTLTPMGLLFKGIIAAVSAFSSNFMGLRDTIESVTGDIQGNLAPLAETINTFYETLFPDTITPQTSIDEMFKNSAVSVDTDQFIKIEKPSSLWDIYVKQGYQDAMNWDEFMLKATQGGWAGGQVNVGDMIKIDTDGVQTTVTQAQGEIAAMMNSGWEDMVEPVTPSTFTERFSEAIQTALPNILTELGGLLNGIRKWADSNIGQGLQSLAKLFGGANDSNGKTPIYEAVRMALNGDLIGAIDAVIPGAGDHLRDFLGTDFGQKIYNAFPQISAGITTLLTNAADWFMKEGVPTLARAAGYIVGRVGAAFGEVMGGVWDSITNGSAAKGAGNALGAIGETVVSPAIGGFNDAMKDAGVTNPIDTFFTALSGALVSAAAVWVIADGFKNGVMSAIKTAVGLAFDLTVWAGGKAVSLLWTLGSALAEKAGITAAFTAAGTAVKTAVGTALSTGLGMITSATSWVISSAASIAGAIATAIATSPISAGIVIGTLLYIAIPDSVKQGIRDAFTNVVDDIFGEGTTYHMNDVINDAGITAAAMFLKAVGREADATAVLQAGLSGNTALQAPVDITLEPTVWADGYDITTEKGQNDLLRHYFPQAYQMEDVLVNGKFNFDGMKASIDQQYLDYFSPEAIARAMEQGMSWDEYSSQIDAVAIKAYELLGEKMKAQGDAFVMPESLPEVNLQGIDIPVGSATLNTEGATVTLDDPTTLVPDNSEELVTYITPDGQVLTQKLEDVNKITGDGFTALGNTIAANIGDGSTLDAERIKSEFLVPLEAAFIAVFGPEGTVMTNMTTFSTTLPIKFTEIGTALATANTDITTKMATLALSFTDQFGKVVTAIQKAVDKIGDWNMAVAGMKPAPNMAGGSGVDGSHAGGLTSVPFDGYIAELHQGERVLTKDEAKDYGNIPRGAMVSGNNGGGNNTVTNQTVNFNESTNVDRIVRELNRRGYRLDKR